MNGVYLRGKNYYLDFTFHQTRIRKMYGPSRKGADKAISKIKGEIAEGKFLDKRKELPPVKFHDFAKEYLDSVRVDRKPGSMRRTISLMRSLDKEFGSRLIQEITTWQIEKFKARRKDEVKPASVNREVALIKHMYSKAILWKRCAENPAKPVKLLKGEVRRTRWLTTEEIGRLIQVCHDRIRSIVIVALNSGMRQGEILPLRRDQVDWENGIITLTDTKNQEVRNTPMNETVKKTLRSIEDRGPLFFPGGLSALKKYFGKALKEAGIADFRFHDLRHTAASHLVMAGVDLNTVREILGQKNLAMTLRYSHLAPDYKARAVGVLDRVMDLIASPESPQKQTAKNVVSITR